MSRYAISITKSASSSEPERADSGNRAFVLLGGLFVVAVTLVVHIRSLDWGLSYLTDGLLLSGACIVVVLLGRAVWCLYHDRPQHPFAAVWHDWQSMAHTRGMVALPILVGYPVFMAAFLTIKCQFPLLRSYAWDPTFARIDAAIHAGSPGNWLLPLLDRAWFVLPVNLVYCEWFLLNAVILGWMAFSLDFGLRRRFWVAFVLCWAVLGTVGALAFLSAGPCFYDHVAGGANPYARQMAALRQVHGVTSLRLQDLLRACLDGGGHVGGASAMPSMHISACVLFTLAGWHRSRRIGALLLAVTLLTQVACVALGWHYAIDGYVAAAGTCLIWWAVGKAT